MRIAIIGSGIAGLGAAYMLRHVADVKVFECDNRLGGHSHTVEAQLANAPTPIAVDTGFIVYNLATYPNLIALFKELGIPTQPSDMSFALSMDRGDYEYAGDSLTKLIGHFKNLLRPKHWQMMTDLARFMRNGQSLCETPESQTLGEYLDANHYSAAFRDLHLLPVAAAIWSATPKDILDFPAQSFGNFFRNHGLLEIATSKRPQWRTVTGGSKTYVDKISTASGASFIRNAQITSIDVGDHAPCIRFKNGTDESFDQIVMATHADDALKLLPEISDKHKTLLGAFQYSDNQTYLHQDTQLMPRRKHLWASWNYLRASSDHQTDKVYLTYWMNRLQNIDNAYPLFVTLNPPQPPQTAKVIKQMLYRHPQFNRRAIAAQRELKTIQGQNNIWFCGSYFGYGFHEDALSSAIGVAEALGAKRTWSSPHSSPAYANALQIGKTNHA
jgi:predicted NAD/FAD-binding protein